MPGKTVKAVTIPPLGEDHVAPEVIRVVEEPVPEEPRGRGMRGVHLPADVVPFLLMLWIDLNVAQSGDHLSFSVLRVTGGTGGGTRSLARRIKSQVK
jgi:hypothetical protein